MVPSARSSAPHVVPFRCSVAYRRGAVLCLLVGVLALPSLVAGQRGTLLPESLEGAKQLVTQGELSLEPAKAAQKDAIIDGLLDDALLTMRLQLQGLSVEAVDVPVYVDTVPEIDSKGKADFKMQILVDPCDGYDFECCDGIFAEPEYKQNVVDATELPKRGDGTEMTSAASRRADSESAFDFSCDVDANENIFRIEDEPLDSTEAEGLEILPGEPPLRAGEDGSQCVGLQAAVKPAAVVPPCWDWNETVDSTRDCSGPGGTAKHCVIIGYSSNAYVPECGGQFRANGDCGLYIEVHNAGDETVLSEVHVAGGLHTGFRTAALPLTYRQDPERIICKGDYELWWTQRTRHNRVVEFRKSFAVVAPECEFDALNSRAFSFAWLDEPIGTQAEIEWQAEIERLRASLLYDYSNTDLGITARRLTEHMIVDTRAQVPHLDAARVERMVRANMTRIPVVVPLTEG